MTTKITFNPNTGEPSVIFVKPYQKSCDPRLRSRYKNVPIEVFDVKEFLLVSALINDGGQLSRAFCNEKVTLDNIRFPFCRKYVKSIEHRSVKVEQW